MHVRWAGKELRRYTMKNIVLMALIVASLSAMTYSAENKDSGANKKMSGYISDARCGARVDKACAKRCASQGVAPVFVDEKSETVFSLGNPEKVKDLIGDHVAVTGT